MATKKTPRPQSGSAKAASEALQIITSITKLSHEQQARVDVLLPQAAILVEDIEDRMIALASIAVKRWNPDASLHDVDEDGTPVFNLDEFLETIDEIGECAMIRSIAQFFKLPEAVVDPLITEKLKSAYVSLPAPPKRDDKGFTIKRARRAQ